MVVGAILYYYNYKTNPFARLEGDALKKFPIAAQGLMLIQTMLTTPIEAVFGSLIKIVFKVTKYEV